MLLPTKREQEKKNQVYYKELIESLARFFHIRLFFLVVSVLVLVLFTNQLHNLSVMEHKYSISQHLKEHVNNFFQQAQSQLIFNNRIISKMVELQYDNFQEYSQLLYKEKIELSNVQKIIYEEKYGVTGQYECLNGKCKCVQFYLVNLWANVLSCDCIDIIYFRYHDPLQNSTNIAFTPSDYNNLSTIQIESLLNNTTQKISLTKIDDNLYMSVNSRVDTSFSANYNVESVVRLRKSEMQKILRNDIELNWFQDVEVSDSMQWVSFRTDEQLEVLSWKFSEITEEISYVDVNTNQTLITFSINIPQIVSYFNFLKLSLLLPLIFLILIFLKQKHILHSSFTTFFRNTSRLISLYQYNIEQIFNGKTPKQSSILTNTTITEFYQQLSQVPGNDYLPVIHQVKREVEPRKFLFVETLKEIVERYNGYARTVFREKNKEILNNKFFIHSSLNELSDKECIKLKEAYTNAKSMSLTKSFFKFAYLSLLLSPEQFDTIIQRDKSPLPQQLVKLLRQISRTVSGSDLRKAFKLGQNVSKECEQELQMRIQVNLLQKYLQILKDLDIHNLYAKELQLQDSLENMNEYLENIKHLLNKHNKNIRTLGR